MHEQTPRNLPWLDLMAVRLPGYGGYLERANRRAADRALRDAIAHRLGDAIHRVDQAVQQCLQRDATGEPPQSSGPVLAGPANAADETGGHQLLTEARSLERIKQHLERVAARVRAAGSGTDAFYAAHHLEPAKADALHAFDLALFDRAEALVRRFDLPNLQHNFLADIETDIEHFEEKLDERAMLLQGIR